MEKELSIKAIAWCYGITEVQALEIYMSADYYFLANVVKGYLKRKGE